MTWKRERRRVVALAQAAVLLVGLAVTWFAVQAAPAQADQVICGRLVKGAILDKYRSMGGTRSDLGCPTSDELNTAKGGKRTVFQGGTIYWSPNTGAHPVWGQIGSKWGSMGWETGALGFPVADEVTNPDGYGKRQQYQGGTIYWSPNTGAHPVWGYIGGLWAKWGYERGVFGYPTSDERGAEENGRSQSFGKYTLNWYPGVQNAKKCTNACVSYRAACNNTYVSQVEAFDNLTSDRQEISFTPTEAGLDMPEDQEMPTWQRAFDDCAPYPQDLSADQGESMYKQYVCHVRYNQGGRRGGDTWDFESWRPNISWDDVLGPIDALRHECNWE